MFSRGLISKLWQKRVVRFACVGAINTLTDVTILNILVFGPQLNTLFANVISASISITLSYFWNHLIVFQREHKISLNLFAKFAAVTGVSILVIQTFVIYIMQHIITIHIVEQTTGLTESQAKFVEVNIAKLAAVLISMVWNYVLYQTVVFKKPKEQDEGVVPY